RPAGRVTVVYHGQRLEPVRHVPPRALPAPCLGALDAAHVLIPLVDERSILSVGDRYPRRPTSEPAYPQEHQPGSQLRPTSGEAFPGVSGAILARSGVLHFWVCRGRQPYQSLECLVVELHIWTHVQPPAESVLHPAAPGIPRPSAPARAGWIVRL